MTDTDQEREDGTLRQMLKTPHKPHKPRDAANAHLDYVVLDGGFFVADILHWKGRSIVADLYLNAQDFEHGKPMEREVKLAV